MVNDSKISQWIEHGKQKGYSQKELEKMLLEKGFSANEIKSMRPRRKVMSILPFLIVILVVVAIYFIISKTPVQTGPASNTSSPIKTQTPSNASSLYKNVTSNITSISAPNGTIASSVLTSSDPEIQKCLDKNFSEAICKLALAENIDELTQQCIKLNPDKEQDIVKEVCTEITYFTIGIIKQNRDFCEKIISLTEMKKECLDRT